jgi:hypothetical protein
MPGCRAGLAVHGRYVARSRHVIELLQDELHYSTIRIQKSVGRSDSTQRRAALEAKREKLQVALDNDLVTVDEFKRRVAALKRDAALIDDEAMAESEWIGLSPAEPLVDWDAGDAAVGEALRRIVRSVRLDESMMPVADSIEWRAPWLAKAKARAARS